MTLDEIRGLIQGDLDAVNAVVRARLKSSVALVDQVAAHIITGGGKGIDDAGVDTYMGAKKGAKVTVKYTEKGGEKTAVGVKDAGKATGKALE